MRPLAPYRARVLEALHKHGECHPDDLATFMGTGVAYIREVLAFLYARKLVSKRRIDCRVFYTAYPRPFSHPCA
ncbi:MAG TPA: hypothetical protein VMZ71_09140 [Gemmataceae bacterium]|nr:hypothetical protein [Gemmataceae bacterium]